MRRRLRASILVSLLALFESGWVPNAARGFYCQDPAISHQYAGDTISVSTLLTVSFVLPCIAMWLTEASNGWRAASGAMWKWYREYFIGFVAVLVLTQAAKTLVGEPRPHFLTTCRPDVAANCTAGSYMPEFRCTAELDRRNRDASRSFPSGHASLSVFTALFMMWFFRQRVYPSISLWWLHGACLGWAMTCSFTRITDHRHHWWDVLAGTVLGAAVATYTVRVSCAGFPRTRVHIPISNGRQLLGSTSSDKELSHVPQPVT